MKGKNFFSEECLKRMSESHMGQPGYWKGKKLTDEARKKISENNGRCWKGKKIPPGHIQKRVESRCSKTLYEAVSPDGVTHLVNNLKGFCKTVGVHQSAASRVVNGKAEQTKGWTFQRINITQEQKVS